VLGMVGVLGSILRIAFKKSEPKGFLRKSQAKN
jgi:hypothetical protein